VTEEHFYSHSKCCCQK